MIKKLLFNILEKSLYDWKRLPKKDIDLREDRCPSFDDRLTSLTQTDDTIIYSDFYDKYNGDAWNSNLTNWEGPHSPLFQLVVDENKLKDIKSADGAASQTKLLCRPRLSNFLSDADRQLVV